MTARRHDVSAPFGLAPTTAAVILTLVAAFLTTSIVTGPVTGSQRGLHVAAAAVMVAALGSVSARTRRGTTSYPSALIVLAVITSASTVFSTWTTIPEVDDYLWSWPLYMAGITEVLLCLKGRPLAAVVTHVGVAAALGLRAWQLDDDAASAVPALGSYLPLFLVSLVIAMYVRPVVEEVAALRSAGEAAARDEAAAVAAVAARNDRLDWIEREAGPWLRRLATGSPLNTEDREECRLLEAGIRDALRAPALTGRELDGVVSEARRRGVEVMLLDDGALDSSTPAVRAGVRTRIAALVADTDTGRITARVAPPGRSEIATVLRSGSGRSSRLTLRDSDLEADRPSTDPAPAAPDVGGRPRGTPAAGYPVSDR